MKRSVDPHSVEQALGYRFQNPALMIEAFTHSSFANRHNLPAFNERMEFLGDSVLGFVVASELFRLLPDAPEGVLTRSKSYLTRADVLADIAEKLGLHRLLLVDESDPQIRHNLKLKENLLEAVIGAVFLDGGLDAARSLVLDLYAKTGYLLDDPDAMVFDHKTALQEAFQGLGLPLPEYVIVQQAGPVHDAEFTAELRFRGVPLVSGSGKSKKQAHQACAQALMAWTDNGRRLKEWLDENHPGLSS